jgi:hypothetical protein
MKYDATHSIGRSIDEIPNRFCLNKVQLAIEKRAPCEFTRLGLTSTGAEECCYKRNGHCMATVGREFDGVFPRVGTGRWIDRHQTSIDKRAIVRVLRLAKDRLTRLEGPWRDYLASDDERIRS